MEKGGLDFWLKAKFGKLKEEKRKIFWTREWRNEEERT
jgi:hypothetical protein